MPWLSATAVVEREFAEAFSEALMEAGALSVDVSDADAGTSAERPLFDEAGGAPAPGWVRARVAALFGTQSDVARALATAFEQAGLTPSTAYEVGRVEDDDWVRRTQAQFGPQQITAGLWIVPSWAQAPDPAAVSVVLDPGLAFGTGTHPTTRLCLRWLAAHVKGGESVIDFGCGSGILGITAAKLGASDVSGVDIEPQAVLAARDNAARNGVAATFVSAAENLHAPAQIVVANILAQPLIVLAPLLADLTLQGGRLALSGILVEQADEVRDAYGAWYDFDPVQEEGGWVLLSGTRAGNIHRDELDTLGFTDAAGRRSTPGAREARGVSLVTRCPRCQTLFRVAAAQLQARAGQVRCGRCMHVFDGFLALAVEQPNAVIEPVRFEPETAVDPADVGPLPAPRETAAPAPAPRMAESVGAEPPAPPARPLSERIRGFADARIAGLKQKYVRRPSPRIARIAACALLAALLGAQMAYAFRSQLAARYPAARAVLTSVCGVAGCTVTLPQRPDLVKIEASDVHMIDAARPALIQLTATLRSYANYDLAYPALDLVLTNANEHALARRIFIPEEYLDQTRDPKAGIPPRAEITIALDLDTRDLNAAGFRLDLLPAPVP